MSAFLKNLPVKVLGGRCLSVWDPLPSYDPILPSPRYTLYLFTQERGGELNQWEGWRDASSQEGSKIPTWLTVSPINLLGIEKGVAVPYRDLVTILRLASFQYVTKLATTQSPYEHIFIFPPNHVCLPYNQSFLHVKTYKFLASFSLPTSPLTSPLIMCGA
jgi:hypothetical protein